MKGVDYKIISKPVYVQFECPHCEETVKVPYDEVDYNTDYPGDGAKATCPECDKEVDLDYYEYE